MSPGDRCDQVIRLIDEALDDHARGTGSDTEPGRDAGPAVEEVPGHWGVYYLRPTR